VTEKTIVGIFDNVIPVEIYHAANLATVWISDSLSNSLPGIDYFPTQSCLYCRSVEKHIDRLSASCRGVIFANTCTSMEKLYEIFLRKSAMDFVEMVDVPKVASEASVYFYKERLKSLAVKMEAQYGLPVEKESLHEAIKLNNKLRNTLRGKKLYRSLLLKDDPLSLSNIKGKIGRIETHEEKHRGDRPRLLVMGARIEEASLAKAVEQEGACVAVYLTDNGDSYNSISVDENTGDPFEALARGYLDIGRGRRTITELPDIKMLREMVVNERIDGIVTLSYPYCARTVYDVAWVKKHREWLDVPMLNLQMDNTGMASAGLRNRISAFIEMVEAREGKYV